MIFDWFKNPKVEVKYRVVELDEPRGTQHDDNVMRESVATLSSHPGFIHLTSKLSKQRSYLRSKMDFEKHESLREVYFLQAGIFWCGWLKQEIARATTKLPERFVDPMEEEVRAFQEIDSHIERVGMD